MEFGFWLGLRCLNSFCINEISLDSLGMSCTLVSTMYAKVFQQIFHSSIAEDYIVRHIFMDLVVLADREGIVDMTSDSISAITRVPKNLIDRALVKLSHPDKSSRSEEEDGRRIVLLDPHREWGWQIVNYEKYRDIRDDEARRAYFREYKRRQRCKTLSTPVLDSPTESNNVTPHTHTKTHTQTKTKAKASANAELVVLPDWIPFDSWQAFVEMRKKMRKPMTDKAQQMIVKRLASFHNQGVDVREVLDQSTMNCWQGIFEPNQQRGNGNGKSRSAATVEAIFGRGINPVV